MSRPGFVFDLTAHVPGQGLDFTCRGCGTKEPAGAASNAELHSLLRIHAHDRHALAHAEQGQTTGELVLCLVIFFCLYAVATQIFRFLGRSGVEIVSRVFGLVVCSIAVNGLITAIKLSFGLATLPQH